MSSLVGYLNRKLSKLDLENIQIGIGLDYGRALIVKAGHPGTKINEVVYMGDVVNRAAKLASKGNKTFLDRCVKMSGLFQGNLKEEYKLITNWNSNTESHEADIVNVKMNDWLISNP